MWVSYKVHEGFPVNINAKEYNDSRYIKVFPNPVYSETQLDFEDLNSEVTHIRLLSVSGAVLEEFTNIPSGIMTLNLQNKPKGIYILQLTTLEGEIHVKKLIKH